MKKKLIAGTTVILFGAAGFLYSSWSRPDSDNTIRLSGNIELTEINIAFKTSGKLTDLMADKGDPVHRGMILARIDQEQLPKRFFPREMLELSGRQTPGFEIKRSHRFHVFVFDLQLACLPGVNDRLINRGEIECRNPAAQFQTMRLLQRKVMGLHEASGHVSA